MKFFELGEVRPPVDEDFMYFKAMATDTTDWKKHHSRKRVRVFSKSTAASSCKMIKKLPVRKEYVRALSFITGYLITSTGATSCDFTYVTQNDPRGDIPAWAINLVATSVAPSIMKTLHRAALRYPAWKEQHDPTFMPWRNVAQQSGIVPLIDMADVLSQPDFDRAPIDESYVSEDAALKEVEQQRINNSDNDD
ncbi:uncharacterized protein DEA37_0001980 [Paragonimus westermani]|uniref:START domain-containing protein n=1 Tax=Paragonimus westermani TaxID=34504 RepID=A0A5J4NA21_9TREM|nr:uncharacterized protein DEA37_0001980 [Paragonimus westermani]